MGVYFVRILRASPFLRRTFPAAGAGRDGVPHTKIKKRRRASSGKDTSNDLIHAGTSLRAGNPYQASTATTFVAIRSICVGSGREGGETQRDRQAKKSVVFAEVRVASVYKAERQPRSPYELPRQKLDA